MRPSSGLSLLTELSHIIFTFLGNDDDLLLALRAPWSDRNRQESCGRGRKCIFNKTTVDRREIWKRLGIDQHWSYRWGGFSMYCGQIVA